MRVLVTGASGFIGRPCVARLADEGAEVHAVSRRAQHVDGPATWHVADVHDPDAIAAVMQRARPTHLLHLAWDLTGSDWATTEGHAAWVTSSLHLLRLFGEAGGRRAVLVGSCAEYDWAVGRCRESDVPDTPATPYGAAKRTLATRAAAQAREAGLSLAWARIFFVYGPGEPPSRLIPSIVAAVHAGATARCTRGDQRRDYLHVDDVADALACMLAADVEGAINVGSGQAVEIAAIARGVAARMGRPDLLALGAIESPMAAAPLVEADVTRLAIELGWRPRLTLEAGLDATVAWYRARQPLAQGVPHA